MRLCAATPNTDDGGGVLRTRRPPSVSRRLGAYAHARLHFLYVNAARGWGGPAASATGDCRHRTLTATRPATGLQRAVRFVILDGWTPSPPRGLLSALAASGAPLVAVLPAAQIVRWSWPVHPVIGHHLARFGSRGTTAPGGPGGLRAKTRTAPGFAISWRRVVVTLAGGNPDDLSFAWVPSGVRTH